MLRRLTPATRQRGAIVRVRLVIQRRQLSAARAVLHHCPQVPEDGIGVFLARNELRAAGAEQRGRELPVRLDADKINPAAAQRASPQQRRQQAVLEPAWSQAVKSAGFGGGSLEHPRQWLGAQWVGLFLGVRVAQSRQARPEEAQKPSWGTAKGALRPCCRAPPRPS